jgi:hypothetical protein
MSYPPHLPAVVLSALDLIEGSPRRRPPPRALRTQTSHTGHRLKNPETKTPLGRVRLHLRQRKLIKLVGVIAFSVVVALGVRLADAEDGATGSLGLQPGGAAGSGVAFAP